MTELMTEFTREFTTNLPTLARRYHDFNWNNLLEAKRVRIHKLSPDKHIEMGLVPEGISFKDYQDIWLLCSKCKKHISNKRSNRGYYQKTKANDCWRYRTRLEKGEITLENECERKKKANREKKARKERLELLKKQAKLFGIADHCVEGMDLEQLEFWGTPLKCINDETQEITYLNPCNFHYDVNSITNRDLKIEDYLEITN